MNSVFDFIISRQKLFLFGILVLCILSGRAILIIPKEVLPDPSLSTIHISLSRESLSAHDAEALLLEPLEEEVQHIPSLYERRGVAFSGGAQLFLDFDSSITPYEALQKTQASVSKVISKLPSQTSRPLIEEIDESLVPLLRINLFGGLEESKLYFLADDLQKKIQAEVPGVLRATIQGRKQEVIEILLDPEKVESYGLLSPLLIETFSKNTQGIQGSELAPSKGAFLVSLPGLFKSLSDIEQLALQAESEGSIKVKDVGYVQQTYKEPTAIFRENGTPVVSFSITKKRGFNLFHTVQQIKSLLHLEQKSWPNSLSVSVIQDLSQTHMEILTDLSNHFVSALFLVVFLILFSFGWRSSLLISTSILLSLALTVLILENLKISLNIVVLFSLILSMSLSLTPLIIIGNFARDLMHQGYSPKESYKKSFAQNGPVVILTTLVCMAFLSPFCFWPGAVGMFMKYLPLTLLVSLGISCLTALLVTPTLATSFFIPTKSSEPTKNIFSPMAKWALMGLKSALAKPQSCLLGFLILLLGSGIFLATFGKLPVFLPTVESQNALLLIHARGSLSLEEKEALVKSVETSIQSHKEIATWFTQINEIPRRLPDDVISMIHLTFHPISPKEKGQVLTQIKQTTSTLPSIVVEVRNEPLLPLMENPIVLNLSGSHFETVESTAQTFFEFLRTQPHISNGQINAPVSDIEWEMTLNQVEAAKFEANTQAAGMAVQILGPGLKLGVFKPENLSEEISIVGRFPKKNRSLSELKNISITTNKGSVPLSNFMTLKPRTLVGSLHHLNGKPTISLTANTSHPRHLNSTLKALQSWAQNQETKDDIQVSFKGHLEQMWLTFHFLLKAFLIGICLALAILLFHFKNFYKVAVIVSISFLSLLGGVMSLSLTTVPPNMVMGGASFLCLMAFSLIGPMVFMTHFDHLCGEKSGGISQGLLKEILLRTASLSLKPVFLIQLSMGLVLIPIIVNLSPNYCHPSISGGSWSFQWWGSFAIPLVGGVIFTSVVGFFLTPLLLLWSRSHNLLKE